ncbi:hypothetical protein ACO0SA_000429 [Hanseniaspora valbyensis]
MSAENGGINKDINKKKRRRRNYDDIDKQVQKLEESSVTKISDTTKLGVTKDVKTLEDVDSDDMNDDELDRLMLLEEEKEKLTANSNVENEDDEDDDEGLDLSLLEEEDASLAPKRRTRGKVIDYKKTAELLDKEKEKKLETASNDDAKNEEEDDDDDDDDDADYVPGE